MFGAVSKLEDGGEAAGQVRDGQGDDGSHTDSLVGHLHEDPFPLIHSVCYIVHVNHVQKTGCEDNCHNYFFFTILCISSKKLLMNIFFGYF